MKESILDVLLFLFEHYFSNEADLLRDRDSLQAGLLQAGFSPTEINKAFEWLDALAQQRPGLAVPRAGGPSTPARASGRVRARPTRRARRPGRAAAGGGRGGGARPAGRAPAGGVGWLLALRAWPAPAARPPGRGRAGWPPRLLSRNVN